MKNKFQEVRIPIRIPMSISSSRLSEPGKCPGKPLIALPDWPCGPIYWLTTYAVDQVKLYIHSS